MEEAHTKPGSFYASATSNKRNLGRRVAGAQTGERSIGLAGLLVRVVGATGDAGKTAPTLGRTCFAGRRGRRRRHQQEITLDDRLCHIVQFPSIAL